MRAVGLGQSSLHYLLERNAIDLLGQRFEIDALALRPQRVWIGDRGVRKNAGGLRTQLVLRPVHDEGAAEALPKNRRSAAQSIHRCRDTFSLALDMRLEEPQKLIARTAHVLGQNGLRVAP